MNTKGESPKPPESRNGREAEGNCVAARLGGEQPEAKLQAQMTNELVAAYCEGEYASLWRSLLPSNELTHPQDSKSGDVRITVGRWGGHVMKGSCESDETWREKARSNTHRTGVRAAIVAMKPVMMVERRAVGR